MNFTLNFMWKVKWATSQIVIFLGNAITILLLARLYSISWKQYKEAHTKYFVQIVFDYLSKP